MTPKAELILQTLVMSLLLIAYSIWLFGQVAERMGLLPARSWVRVSASELHPFIPATIVANYLAASWDAPFSARGLEATIAAGQLVVWLLTPPDDRWKRRRRRLKERWASRGAGKRLAPTC